MYRKEVRRLAEPFSRSEKHEVVSEEVKYLDLKQGAVIE